MCKLLMMTGITDPSLAYDFMLAAAPRMSLGNNDGIGYAAVDSQGRLFSERWHKNDFFDNRVNVISAEDLPMIKKVIEPVKHKISVDHLKPNFSNYGEINLSDMRTVTMHTRMATCGREFDNTHPFIDQDTSLVHNGVISNSKELNKNKISTCDSEVALQLYLEANLSNTVDPEQFNAWLQKMKGGWAFGILSRTTEGRRILDVTRYGSFLNYAFIPGLGTVFATTASIIEDSAKDVGLDKPETHVVTTEQLQRFDAVTGEQIANFAVTAYKFKSYSGGNSSGGYYGRSSEDWDDSHWNRQTRGGSSQSSTSNTTTTGQATRSTTVNKERFLAIATRKAKALHNRIKCYDQAMGTTLYVDYMKLNTQERTDLETYFKDYDIHKLVEELSDFLTIRSVDNQCPLLLPED